MISCDSHMSAYGYYSEQNFSELLLAGFDFITLAKTNVRWIRPEIDKQREALDDFSSVCPFDPPTHRVSVLLMHDFEKSVSMPATKAVQKKVLQRPIHAEYI